MFFLTATIWSLKIKLTTQHIYHISIGISIVLKINLTIAIWPFQKQLKQLKQLLIREYTPIK